MHQDSAQKLAGGDVEHEKCLDCRSYRYHDSCSIYQSARRKNPKIGCAKAANPIKSPSPGVQNTGATAESVVSTIFLEMNSDIVRHDMVEPKQIENRDFGKLHNQLAVIAALVTIISVVIFLFFTRIEVLAARLLLVKMLSLAVGGLILFMSFRYGTVVLRAKKLPNRGKATVVEVSCDTGFDSSYAIGRSVVPGYGYREQGQGRNWTWFFMLWNEIRPDHWYPILELNTDTGPQRRTFTYGGLKNTWSKGEAVTIAWDDLNNGIAYPLEGKWLLVKSGCYCLMAMVFLFIGAYRLPLLMNVMQEDDVELRKTISEVYQGIPQIYDGTIDVSDDQVVLQFAELSGKVIIPVECSQGDRIGVWSSENLLQNENNQWRVYVLTSKTVGDYTYESRSIHNVVEGDNPRIVVAGRIKNGKIIVSIIKEE